MTLVLSRFPIMATFFTLLGVCILCALGTWQLHRLAWKNALIHDLQDAYSVQALEHAVPLDEDAMRGRLFGYGNVSGLLAWDKAFLLGPRVRDKIIGNSVIVPLIRAEDKTIFVNLGWSDKSLDDIRTLMGDASQETVNVTGLARKPYWSSFVPKNKPDQDIWYRPDLQQIAQAKNTGPTQSFLFYAYGITPVLSGVDLPLNDLWSPPNNHRQYAFFWFSMAGVLMIIYWLRFFFRAKA